MPVTVKTKQSKTKYEYFPALENSQKEHVCGGLLKSYLAAMGYIVAEPRPDLGDDIWFATRDEALIRRGQIKSVHTAEIAKDKANCQPETKSRRYNISPQLSRLRTAAPDFFYFLLLADERFLGYVENEESNSCPPSGTWLQIEKCKITANPSVLFSRKEEKKGSITDYYQANADGFHLGCLPLTVLQQCLQYSTAKKNADATRGGFWLKVETKWHMPYMCIRYSISGMCVTEYFGGVKVGLHQRPR